MNRRTLFKGLAGLVAMVGMPRRRVEEKPVVRRLVTLPEPICVLPSPIKFEVDPLTDVWEYGPDMRGDVIVIRCHSCPGPGWFRSKHSPLAPPPRQV